MRASPGASATASRTSASRGPEPDALYRIDPGGPVKLSSDGGKTWEDRGTTGGEPQDMFATSADHLLVALIDGSVNESDDGGRTWTDLVTPPA